MQLKLSLALSLICVGLCSALQSCSTPELYAEPRYGWANASGHFGLSNNGSAGTTSLQHARFPTRPRIRGAAAST
jgi:hypothetical protein